MRFAVAAPVLLVALLPVAVASAQEAAPKVAVVVAGDADDALRAAARRVDDALADDTSGVRLPADLGLRDALRGEPAPTTGDDGLAEVRATRRRLGRSEADDLPALVSVGRMTGAVVVVVVRVATSGVPEAVVLDVGARQFFVGSLDPVATSPDGIAGYVRTRATDAAARARSAPPADAAPEHGGAPVERPTTPDVRPEHAARHAAPPASPAPARPAQSEDLGQWLSHNWIFVVGGALLCAGAIALIVAAQPSDPGPPVLRFQFGNGS